MCAKNYKNRAWSDKVIAKIKWCSFLTHSVDITYSRTKITPILVKLYQSATFVAANTLNTVIGGRNIKYVKQIHSVTPGPDYPMCTVCTCARSPTTLEAPTTRQM